MLTIYSPSLGIQVEEAPMEFSIGEVLMFSEQGDGSSETPERRKNIILGTGGAVKTEMTLWSCTGGQTVYGQIYRNGSPVGIQRETTLGEPGETFTEDISGWETGDTLELWLWITAPAGCVQAILGLKVLTFPYINIINP